MKLGKDKTPLSFPCFNCSSERLPLTPLFVQGNMCLPFWTFLIPLSLYSTPFLFPSVECSRLCPHQCVCYEHADLVDCHARGFEHVPRGLPHGTWLLELGGNNLSEIGSRGFTGLWSLRVLILSNSQIQEIQPQVKTKGWTSLEKCESKMYLSTTGYELKCKF